MMSEPKRHEFTISRDDKETVDSIFVALEAYKKSHHLPRFFEREIITPLLSPRQNDLVDRVYATDPRAHGFLGPYFGIEPVPDDLHEIPPQKFSDKGEPQMTKTHFLPKPTFDAYNALNQKIVSDLGRPLLIASGYRTSIKQALLFLAILRINNYDIQKTTKRVAIPGYSEHGTPSKLALDFLTTNGLPASENPEGFEKTSEYEWLLENANYFGFYLSYPENNTYGVMFEPWHWRHVT
jgi:D-alanyl-D-alanine carboxypeptidase